MVDLLSGPWGPLIIFAFRIGDVSLATLRMVLAVRGQRAWPPIIGFFEILIWILAAGSVVQNLASPWHVLGYAAGFSAGTHVGLWLEGRLALGLAAVQIVTTNGHRELANALREKGFGVTELEGQGRDGPVGVLVASLRRRFMPDLLGVVDQTAPDSFVSVQDDRLVRRGWLLSKRRK